MRDGKQKIEWWSGLKAKFKTQLRNKKTVDVEGNSL